MSIGSSPGVCSNYQPLWDPEQPSFRTLASNRPINIIPQNPYLCAGYFPPPLSQEIGKFCRAGLAGNGIREHGRGFPFDKMFRADKMPSSNRVRLKVLSTTVFNPSSPPLLTGFAAWYGEENHPLHVGPGTFPRRPIAAIRVAECIGTSLHHCCYNMGVCTCTE